jgi:integrase/recombinase XerD
MPKESRELILLTDEGAVAAPPALVRAGLETLPVAIAAAGARTSERFIDFFTANIRNRNTRMAYAVAVRQFFIWCEERALQLEAIRPTTVAAYVEQLSAAMAKPSVKQHLRPSVNSSITWSLAVY